MATNSKRILLVDDDLLVGRGGVHEAAATFRVDDDDADALLHGRGVGVGQELRARVLVEHLERDLRQTQKRVQNDARRLVFAAGIVKLGNKFEQASKRKQDNQNERGCRENAAHHVLAENAVHLKTLL